MNRGGTLARSARALVAAVALAAVSAPAVAAPAHAPGEVIVRFKDAVAPAGRMDALRDLGARRERALPSRGMELVHAAPGVTVAETVAALERDPRVAWAEPNFLRPPALVPNDPSVGLLWGLDNTGQTIDGVVGTPDADIDAPAAWDVTTGDSSVVVAVVDTGAVLDHPDLAPNLWTNPGEVADGVDNDLNGIVDDLHGADFTGAVPDGDPTDVLAEESGSHGTHVASIVAGRGGNALGMTGVAPNVRVMPLRFLGAQPTVADEILAFRYARAKGARIVNGSFGATAAPSLAERQEIADSPGTLFVFAAGNGGGDTVGDSNELPQAAFYPCSYDLPNIICVAASDENDGLSGFSNFGAASVDLAAPGTRVLGAVGTMRRQTFDDFEGPLTNWSVGGGWGVTTATSATGAASLSDSPVGGYAASADSSAELTPSANLAGFKGCRARLDVLVATQPDNDALHLETSSDNGASWTSDAKWSGTTNGAFVGRSVDLSHRDGTPVLRLRLRMLSDASVQDDGVWVDNVDLSCLSPAADYTGAAREFAFRSGTSMAAPHVAGVAALVRSVDPTLGPAAIKSRILEGVDPLSNMAGKTVTGGRLNARSAVRPDLIAQTGVAQDVSPSSAVLTGGVTAHVSTATVRFEVGTTTAYEMTAPPPAAVVAGDVAQPVSATLGGLEPGRTYHYRLVAESSSRRTAGDDLTFTTQASPLFQLTGSPDPVVKAQPRPCARLKGKKRSVCLRRQAALKRCAKLRPGRSKRLCIVRAKRLR